MGRDKLQLIVEGRPLVSHAIDALVGAGASEVIAIGGPRGDLGSLGARVVPDTHPGEGPLGAILTALSQAACDLVAVVSGDTAGLVADDVERLVLATEPADVDAVVAVLDGESQPLLACYRRDAVLPGWQELFDSGERSPRRALGVLRCRDLVMDGARITDLDSGDDLRRYAARRRRPDRGPDTAVDPAGEERGPTT